MLIPIDASEASQWGLDYAISRFREGLVMKAYLLCIAEVVQGWPLLRFRAEDLIREQLQALAAIYLWDASAVLGHAGVPHQTHYREADPVRGIVEFAEEMGCTEIVVPRKIWCGILPYGLAQKLSALDCPVPITHVRRGGTVEI